jgi:integrating conjugative element membrane protein (TIGR03745 family)
MYLDVCQLNPFKTLSQEINSMYQSEFVVARLRHLASRALTRIGTLAILGWLTCKPAFADLPSVEAPQSSGGTGLMGQIKGYLQDGMWSLVGWSWRPSPSLTSRLLPCTLLREVRNERATWTKFGAIIVVGVVLLVAVIWLLGKSADIIL